MAPALAIASVIAAVLAVVAGPAQAAPSRLAGSGSFSVVNYGAKFCLRAAGKGQVAVAYLWNCSDAAGQSWHWGAELGNTGYRQLVDGAGGCLEVGGKASKQGAAVIVWGCLGQSHRDQFWAVREQASCGGYDPIANAGSGMVLTPMGNSIKEGGHWGAQGKRLEQEPFQDHCRRTWALR
jgi:Ricin-type beta-trefoil lectin domain